MTHLTWNHPFIATISEQGAHECITRGGGMSQILGWMYARGGGGSFRCVLCATGGGVINGT